MPNSHDKQRMSNAIRALTMDAVQAANSGHPGMPLGMADAATALFCDHLKFSASAPNWVDRDRFVLSAGHGSMLLYALLYLTGYADMNIDEIRNFRQLGARTAGHLNLDIQAALKLQPVHLARHCQRRWDGHGRTTFGCYIRQ